MKKIILLAFIIISLNACQKDKITVNENKNFYEVNPEPSTNPMYNNQMVVALNERGDAGFKFGGDAIMPATYKINGKTLKIYQNNETYKFTIASETELRYKDKVLKLK